MREIKFRVWDGERMCKPHCPGNWYVIDNDGDLWIREHEGLVYAPDSHVVMQFTGLTDSEGTEIYEGDDIEYTVAAGTGAIDAVIAGTLVEKTRDAGTVEILNGAWRIMRDNKEYRMLCHVPDIRVVGNIYELQPA